MSLWKIAWRSIQQRGIASALTAFSMALGVMLVVVVLSIHGVVEKSFHSNSALGYDMIVGAKGGKLQLTLNTVYYLSQPIENIPYDYYLEFLPDKQREKQIPHSIKYQVQDKHWSTSELQALSSAGMNVGGPQSLGQMLAMSALEQADNKPMRVHKDGNHAAFVAFAIPLLLGDYYGEFRVVGTSSDMFDKLALGVDKKGNPIKFEFSAGRNFEQSNDEHGFFEAVVGYNVARTKKLNLGDQFSITHGDPDGDSHDQQFTVVGILAQSYTPIDRAAFVNMEGFFLIDDHIKSVESDTEEDEETVSETSTASPSNDNSPAQPLPIEEREITSMLIRSGHAAYSMSLENGINEGSLESSIAWSEYRPEGVQRAAQAVRPIAEIYGFFATFVDPIKWVLIVLTIMVCVVSGVSILVSIYNSMNDRKHEIAVMRALGADRITVMSVILFESIMLSLGGGALGWLAAHALNALASPFVESKTGVAIKFWNIVTAEAVLIPGLVLLAILAGAIPAMSAYRTDVAKSLGK